MPPARQHVQHVQQQQPSSVSIGKKPMAYPPQQQQQQQQQQQPAQPQPKSARAAAKAPLVYHPQQQQQQQQAQQNLHHHPPATPASTAAGKQRQQPQATPGKPKGDQNKIWSTSTTEERERIKEFWLGLSEEERRNLVKIEKDTVLRKMKEQQRHSCSCAVCGRKRNAIEEELEVLYDAYYEELEQYANYQQRYVSSGGTIPPPPGPGPFPGSVELDKNGVVVSPSASPASARGKNRNRNQRQTQQVVPNGRKSLHQHPHLHTHPQPKESEFDDDDPEEEEYEEEEEYDEEEDEEDEDEDEDEVEDVGDIQPKGKPTPVMPRAGARRPAAARGRNRGSAKVNGSAKRDQLFGGGLAVTGPGNILTVADDLLKNDGQKFLEMMEQLAERRMQREEEASADVEDDSEEDSEEESDMSDGDGDDLGDGDEGEGSEGEGDEDEDEDDEDEDDEDEEEQMTEEQKMEEGKRMFSIFAARMFEQRVLQAYREKVAQERQLQLLRELDDEDKLSKEREAKKQSQNQKKKDKKRLQKQLKEEERAQKAAEKAAEEAAVKAKQAAIEEETKKKKEEERVKRETVRRAQEEERTRKEEEKKRRQQEEREREQERERKRKEKEEKAKAERREREERERKEREEKERKAKEERERKEKEDKEKAEKARLEKEREKAKVEKEKQEKAEREAKERQQRASSSALAGPSTSNGKSTNRGPRNGNGANAVASSSSSVSPRPASSATTPTKRILNKPQLISVSTSSPAIIGPSLRQHPPSLTNIQQPLQQSTPSRGPPQLSSQPATPISPPISNHIPPPPQTPNLMFAQGQGIIPSSTMSPRMPNFPPISFPFGAPGLQQQQPGGPPLPPSIGRGFNPAPGAFDPPFPRASIGGNVNMMNGGVPPSPIGPPPKSKTPLASSSTMPLAPGSGRRSSVPVHSEAGPGPVARPQVAPIARPGTGVTSGSGEAGSSTSGSPRRSPSPKGVLGSSALAADDDEVVPSGNRRGASTAPIGVGLGPVGTGVVGGGGNAGPSAMGVGSGQGWISPSRPDGLGIRSPWGPPPGFGVAPGRPQTTAQQQQQQSQQQPHPPIGPPGGVGHHQPPPHHHPGMSGPIPHPAPVPPPLGGASLWASVPTPGSAPDWNTPASFFAGHPSFLNNQNTTASPPPHSAS